MANTATKNKAATKKVASRKKAPTQAQFDSLKECFDKQSGEIERLNRSLAGAISDKRETEELLESVVPQNKELIIADKIIMLLRTLDPHQRRTALRTVISSVQGSYFKEMVNRSNEVLIAETKLAEANLGSNEQINGINEFNKMLKSFTDN